jgi:hypothetical protein
MMIVAVRLQTYFECSLKMTKLLFFADHSAERLQIERERLELEKEQSEKRVREKVEKLQKQLAKKSFKRGLSAKALKQIERVAKILS